MSTSDPFETGIEIENPARVYSPYYRMFAQYVPDIPVKIDGTVIGCFVHCVLESRRVPGYGPEIPPNIVEVTGRTQEGLDLDGIGWLAFAYDPETDTFTLYDRDKAWPTEESNLNPCKSNCFSLRQLARTVWSLGAFYLKGKLKWE